LLRAVLRDRLLEEVLLVLRRTPATVDHEGNPVVGGSGCRMTQRTEQRWIEVRHTRNPVIEDRRAVGDGTVGLAQRTAVLAARDVAGWCSRRGRGCRRGRRRRQVVAEGCGDRREDDQQGG